MSALDAIGADSFGLTADDENAGVICRECGCTENDACVDDAGRACSWAEPDLCTACADVGLPFPNLQRAGFVLP
jgi:hypothetical protein